jgi:glutaconate CoA-transferase subunit A
VAEVLDLQSAAGLVPDGASVYVGGAVLRRKPMAFLRALVDAGRRDLHAITFAGSVDIELLVGSGAASAVSSAYVGLGASGFAPIFKEAVESGEIADHEYSEWTMLHGLRAAAMGVPFLPTRGGAGSGLLGGLTVAEVDDPYGTGRYLAIGPMRPDVTVLHAWRASPEGHVQFADPPEHLWDVDVVAARAARRVIVTVDEIVPFSAVAEDPRLTVLFGAEVDAVVEAPGGSWPTASPPGYDEDHHAVAAYAESADLSMLALEPAA